MPQNRQGYCRHIKTVVRKIGALVSIACIGGCFSFITLFFVSLRDEATSTIIVLLMDKNKIFAILFPFLFGAVQWMLWEYLAPFAWLFFFPSVFFSAWLGGWRYGLATITISVCLVWLFFHAPFLPWSKGSAALLISSIVAIVTGGVMCLFVERFRAAERATEAAKNVADLDAAESRFNSTFELAAMGIALLSPEGHWLRVNRRLCEIVGYSTSELLHLTFQDITHPEDLNTDLEYVTRMLKREIDNYAMEKRYIRKDGSLIWINLTVSLHWKPDGTPDYFISAIEDIHRRKLAEFALREREMHLQLFFAHAPMALAMFDRHMRYMACSRRWLSDYHLEYVDVRGLSHYEIFPEIGEAWKQVHKRALNGEVIRADDDRFDRMDGTSQWLRWEVRPWFESSGDIGGIVILTEDITERKSLELDLQKWATAFQKAEFGLAIGDARNNVVIACNPAFASRRGYRPEELVGRPVLSLFPADIANDVRKLIRQVDEAGHGVFQTEHICKDGSRFPVLLDVTVTKSPDGEPLTRVTYATDISERLAAEKKLMEQANYDALTRLPNRRLFDDRLQQELLKAERNRKLTALLFVDLDHFKYINDTMGHDVGDDLLVEAALRIKNCMREYDTLARFGGDEFTVLLVDLEDLAPPARIAQAIIDSLSKPFELRDKEFFISASIGIALAPDDARNGTDLVKRADQAMYKAKAQGRHCYQFFTRGMQEAIALRTRLASELRNALQRNQFELYYQPIVVMTTGAIHKAEALLRWVHPQEGLISPAAFIPIAEDTGFIVDLGEWVSSQVVKQTRQWREFWGDDFQVSINQSPVQLRHVTIAEKLLEKMQQVQLSGHNVVLEITESLLMNNDKVNVDNLIKFRNAGVQIAIDDFGTGYSALSYLKKFDVDYIKIDQSFTRNLAPDSTDFALCEAIIVMAHKLGILVIAEGIETQQQRELLLSMGCDFGQGYLYSPPLPVELFEQKFLSSRCVAVG